MLDPLVNLIVELWPVLKRRLKFMVLMFCLGLPYVFVPQVMAEHEVNMYNNFSVTSNQVDGSGDDQSALTEGTSFLNILTVNGKGTISDFNYRYSIGAKATDDSRNDVQKLSLTRLQGRLSNQNHTFTAGDTFAAFSQYSLNTAVKGVSYRYIDNGNNVPDVTVIYGIAYPRWDNFWGLDAVQRHVAGARLQQHVNDDFWVAASYVQSEDQERVNGGSLFDTKTIAFDWEYQPIMGLTISGESAFSDTDESISSVAADDNNKGSAHKLEAIGDGGPSRVVLSYERISPNFMTLLGAATPDREKTEATWRYKFTKKVNLNFGLLWYRDNLGGDLAFRTDNYRPEIGMTVKRMFSRRYSVADVTYKFDRSYGGGNSTKDHHVNLGYRDRFGMFDSDTNVGMTIYKTSSSRDDEEFIYNTTLSTRYTLGSFVLKPSLRLGGWTLDNDLDNIRDRVWEYSIGLGVDIPSMKITSQTRVGANRLDKETGDDLNKMMASVNIYYRPDFLEMFEYSQIYVRGHINDFSYSTNNRDFTENSVTAGLIVRF